MKRFYYIMSLLGIMSLWSCAVSGGDKNQAHIKSFSYHYDGTIGGDSRSYKLRVENQTPVLTVYDMNRSMREEVTDTVDMELVQKLEALLIEHKVKKYNGFDKFNRLMSDGSGFSLYITYEDGKEVEARGHNKFPKGYHEFAEALDSLFQPYSQQLFDKHLVEPTPNEE